jgi:predicted ester cyclase
MATVSWLPRRSQPAATYWSTHEENHLDDATLERIYRDYLACLNAQDWAKLSRFVQDDVRHNGRVLGLQGYRAMLEHDFERMPDLRFEIGILIASPPRLGCRLLFDVTPTGELMGLPVNGRRVRFAENVFYAFRDGRIEEVWSVLDKLAVEAQL